MSDHPVEDYSFGATPTDEENNNFFLQLERKDVPNALKSLKVTESGESDSERKQNERKRFNDFLMGSAMDRNCDKSRPSSDWSIPQSLWRKLFALICEQWNSKWAKHLNKGNMLFSAIYHDHLSAVEVIFDQLVSQEEINKCFLPTDDTPLKLAIYADSPSSFQYLISKRGIDLNACDHDGRSPLSTALEGNKISFLRELLNHGADPNRQIHPFG